MKVPIYMDITEAPVQGVILRDKFSFKIGFFSLEENNIRIEATKFFNRFSLSENSLKAIMDCLVVVEKR
jgi:hypothetical protein